ncbi:MAG: FecR domain-containing protein [Xanthobacteraceae bacterium]
MRVETRLEMASLGWPHLLRRATAGFAGKCFGSAALVLTIATLGGAPALAQNVGTASAVNPASTGKPPGGAVRTLTLGSEVVHNERIQTDAAGSVQLLFVDKTSMSIGPNSDVTIDEYVFDPNANTGKMAVTVSKGVMRFVGGQVSHTGDATVTTPSASIGIRGGTVIFDAKGTIVSLFGKLTITGKNGDPFMLYRPNMFVNLGPGGSLTPQFVTQEMIAFYNARFQAKPGQTGGTGHQVTATRVNNELALYDVTGSILPTFWAVQSPTTTTVPTECNDPSSPIYMTVCTTFQTTLQSVRLGAQTAAAAGSVPPPPPPPPPPCNYCWYRVGH